MIMKYFVLIAVPSITGQFVFIKTSTTIVCMIEEKKIEDKMHTLSSSLSYCPPSIFHKMPRVYACSTDILCCVRGSSCFVVKHFMPVTLILAKQEIFKNKMAYE